MKLSPEAAALLAQPDDRCKWPMPTPRYWCGRPATHGAYCAAHHVMSRDPEIVSLSGWSIAALLRLRPARVGSVRR